MNKHKVKFCNKDNKSINVEISELSHNKIFENKEQKGNNKNWENDCILLKDITLNEKTLYVIGN